MTGRAFLVAAVLLAPRFARADDKDADAERLFREGQKLMTERRFGEACPKLEAVYRKDHQLGTLLNLAYCHKEQGATWQAWIEFKEAEQRATELKIAERRDFAQKRLAELEKSLARAVVDVASTTVLDELLVEDRPMPGAEKGAVFAVEPGQRNVTFRAKGKRSVTQLVTFTKGDRPQKVTVPELVDEPPEPPPVAKEVAPPPRRAAVDPPNDGSTQRTVAFVLGGVGAAGLVAGAVSGLMTLGNDCTRRAKAASATACTSDDKATGDTTSMIANVGLIGGGALLAGAVVLYLTAPRQAGSGPPKDAALSPAVGIGWAGFEGAF